MFGLQNILKYQLNALLVLLGFMAQRIIQFLLDISTMNEQKKKKSELEEQ